MEDLKPCPFCGCKAMVFGGGNSSRGRLPARVECASRLCMASTREANDRESATAIWNRRTEPTSAKDTPLNLPPHAIASDHPSSPSKSWSITELAWIAIRDQAFHAHYKQAQREAVAAAVPEGYKLVPIEPTEEMIRAMDKVLWPGPSRKSYIAALTAAPEVKP